MQCHECTKEIDTSVCIGIAGANHDVTIALLHFCEICFIQNAGIEYVKEMWTEAKKYVGNAGDEELKTIITKKLESLDF